MPRMVDVVIDSVRVSLTNQQRMVLLKEVDSDRYLPIWIGPYEAEAITIALQEIEVARPQTHDLLKNTISALGARLIRVEVVALRDDVFYGNLVVEANGRVINVDSRPSDALALAVRYHVPVQVSRDILDSAGIQPSQDLQQEPPRTSISPASSTSPAPAEEPASEERLSVFEDFLSNINMDDLPGTEDDEDDSSDDKPDRRKKK